MVVYVGEDFSNSFPLAPVLFISAESAQRIVMVLTIRKSLWVWEGLRFSLSKESTRIHVGRTDVLVLRPNESCRNDFSSAIFLYVIVVLCIKMDRKRFVFVLRRHLEA